MSTVPSRGDRRSRCDRTTPSDDPCLTNEDALLRRYARHREPRVQEELVRRFTPFARSLAMRYAASPEPLDDLLQVANLGLIKAIEGFDPDRGRPFAAYGAPTILGELRRHFRDNVWNLRLPRSLGELALRIEQANTQLADELGRYPVPSETADWLGLPTENVIEALVARDARYPLSLEAPRNQAEDGAPTTIADLIPEGEPGYDHVEAVDAANTADLDEIEQRVLTMRFNDEMSQKDIGAVLGVSQMQVSRISRRALWKLLAAVRGEPKPETGPPSSYERV